MKTDIKLKSDVLNYLQERGFIKDGTDLTSLDDMCVNRSITLYTGYDLTAKSLHAGNLMTLMMLRAFQKFDHNVITLLGGATTKIGDPTGRDTARPILTDTQISENLTGISRNFHQFLNADRLEIVNNGEWLMRVGYIDLLQEVGRHFTIDRMSAMDSVSLRMERGSLTFTEFNYMLMQAYDFLHLFKNRECVLQIGGSDQWGNIIQGVELIRRIYFEKEQKQAKSFGLTCPLITKSDGSKMGKSADGAIWLTKDLLSHFEYFQYFRNIADDDIGKCLRFFTELPMTEVQRYENLRGKEINEAKKILAFEATKIAHGEKLA
ncbi:MAG: tyrosyl-tRNA synthetase, partial [Candidatus Deianiraeaceae bacterium]